MLSALNRYFYGGIFPLFLCLCGVLVTCKMGFLPLKRPHRAILALREDGGSFSSLTLALAGTLGVGNIVGVAAAISVGGAGAVFWMWVSAAVMMLVKYAEIYLSVKYRVETDGVYHGGPMYYMPRAFKSRRTGQVFAVTFTVLCLISSVFLGNVIQIRAVADAAFAAGSFSPTVIAVAVLICAFFWIYGDRKRVSRFTSLVIPPLCLVYIAMTLAVIAVNVREVGGVFAAIFNGAFRPAAVGGGAVYAFFLAMRQGIAKGAFSHEGGCGTSPLSYAGNPNAVAERTGIWGIVEVFVDTILICTLSAVVFLLETPSGTGDGFALVSAAFDPLFGGVGRWMLLFAIAVFAFSTLVCWSFYGSECVRFFTKSKHILNGYRFVFCLFTVAGVFIPAGIVWEISDFCTMTMTLLNILCVLRLSGEISRAVRAYFAPDRRKPPRSNSKAAAQPSEMNTALNGNASVGASRSRNAKKQ